MKVEYPQETILRILYLIDKNLKISGIENINTIKAIIDLLDTGIEKDEENKEEKEKNND